MPQSSRTTPSAWFSLGWALQPSRPAGPSREHPGAGRALSPPPGGRGRHGSHVGGAQQPSCWAGAGSPAGLAPIARGGSAAAPDRGDLRRAAMLTHEGHARLGSLSAHPKVSTPPGASAEGRGVAGLDSRKRGLKAIHPHQQLWSDSLQATKAEMSRPEHAIAGGLGSPRQQQKMRGRNNLTRRK